MIYSYSFKHTVPAGAFSMDVTSRSSSWGKHLSPFNLGPVNLYDGYWSHNIENAYQFASLYAEHMTVDGVPSPHYWEWAQKGWKSVVPIKYPLGVWSKPECHWWKGKKLTRLEAQNQIFLPLYKQAVTKTSVFARLKELYETNQDIYLIDFEGYDHRFLEKSWEQVMNDPDRPIGQGFALCMILEGFL